MAVAQETFSIRQLRVEASSVTYGNQDDQNPFSMMPAAAYLQLIQLAKLSNEILDGAPSINSSMDAAAPAVALTTPLPNPQQDPHLPTEIPRDAQGNIDFNALLDRLEKLFNFLRCNIMNLTAATEVAQFLMNLGDKKVWDKLTKEQRATLSKIMSQKIDGPELEIFGKNGKGIKIHSLGELVAYAACLATFYTTPGTDEDARIKAAKEAIQKLFDQLNGLSDDFVKNCDFINNYKKAVTTLYQDVGNMLEKWADAHWKGPRTNGYTLDDNGRPADYSRWLIDAQGYMGKFLFSIQEDFGSWDKAGKWQKNYYKILINDFIASLGANPNPFLVFLYLMTIIDKQNEDRQEELVGASQPGKYLGKVSESISDALKLLLVKKWDTKNAQEFFQAIEDAKRLISNDADIDPSLQKSFLDNLDTFLLQKDVHGNTLEEDFYDTTKKTPSGLDDIVEFFTSSVFDPTKPAATDLWTKMCSALTENNDTCKEQSSAQGSLVSNMGNTLNQFFAIIKSLRDEYLNQEKGAVKNELVR